MPFDYVAFFRSQLIHYADQGNNVKRGEVNVRCPFCGVEDRSQHLGVNLHSGFWACWRNAEHKGKRPHRLIRALTGWDEKRIDEVINDPLWAGSRNESLDDMRQRLEASSLGLLDKPKARTSLFAPEISYPKGTRDLTGCLNYSSAQSVLQYLQVRGYRPSIWPEVCKLYQLAYALDGDMMGRLIVPAYCGGKLRGYQGRAISKHAENRYLTRPFGRDGKCLLYNYDNAWASGGKWLILVEGPLDMMKLDYHGRRHGIRATCGAGVNMIDEQMTMVLRLSKKFDQTGVLYDPAASQAALGIVSRLALVNAHFIPHPEDSEDPGAMTERQVTAFCSRLLATPFS